MNAVVSNNARKIRASRPDGIALPSKGNVRSTSTNGKLHRDTKPAFPQVVFGEMKAYSVDPYEVVNGIFFDLQKTRRVGIVPGSAKATTKAETGQKKAKTAKRTPPAPGTRTSLRSIRSKG